MDHCALTWPCTLSFSDAARPYFTERWLTPPFSSGPRRTARLRWACARCASRSAGLEPAVLDEPAVGEIAAAHRAGQVEPRPAALERRFVHDRRPVDVVADADAERLQEGVVGVIPGHGQHPVVRTPEGTQELANDWVLAMTGYHPDYVFLEGLGIRIGDDVYRTPIVDEASFESSRPGLYLAGTVCGGYLTNRWFIENGRFHARQIAKHIAHKPTEAVRFDEVHWKTAE